MNPFNYQGPVTPSHLIDRRSELDVLQRAAADRIAIRLAAPRRFGKSSLLDAHVLAMREAGHRAVRVDFSKVATLGDAAARVARAYSALPNDPGRSVRRWAARLGVSASVPTGSIVASEHRVARSTLQEALDRLLTDQRHVQRDADGRPYLLDPALAEWLRRR